MKNAIITVKFIINFLYLLAHATALSFGVICFMMLTIATISGISSTTTEALVLPSIVGVMWMVYIVLEYVQTPRRDMKFRLPFPEVGLLC